MSSVNSLITVSEAAARTGCSAATIRDQFDTGLLVGERNSQGHRLIDPDSLPVPDRGLSVSETCALLGRSGDTVRRWFDTGVLKGRRDRNGNRRIDPKSAKAILKDLKTS